MIILRISRSTASDARHGERKKCPAPAARETTKLERKKKKHNHKEQEETKSLQKIFSFMTVIHGGINVQPKCKSNQTLNRDPVS